MSRMPLRRWSMRLERLWRLRRLRRLLPVLGTLRLVLDPTKQAACSSTVDDGRKRRPATSVGGPNLPRPLA
jgi:hypothetical protein